ncbi:MAG TPA: hypothetical protein DCY13_07385, partial [Verrucomicrobiales bacterium]|nr:hypothetical protein [Verrucomicrobiales bacterium]
MLHQLDFRRRKTAHKLILTETSHAPSTEAIPCHLMNLFYPFAIWRSVRALFGALVGVTLILGSSVNSPAQNLVHRYSFDVDARDLVGTAHGEFVGTASVESRAAVLTGVKPSYVNLPNDLVINLTSASFVVWVTWNGGPVWQRIW